ncbi:MAG: RNA methyltransferase [Betaproteobacteria bacterium]|nr:RNA methyltransferase [Betaproteobacteria bacterium]
MTKPAKFISSPTNPLVQEIARLAESAKLRRTLQQTLIDGPHLVAAFAARHGTAHTLAASESGLQNEEAAQLFERCKARRRVVFSDRLFERVAPVASPVGLLAIIDIPPAPPPAPLLSDAVFLDGIQDAGNVGSILRTAAAAGMQRIAASTGTADFWSPRVLRAGMGAHFDLALISNQLVTDAVKNAGGQVIVATGHARLSIYDADLRAPGLWIFGGEGAGVSATAQAAATLAVSIPMASGSESLNVAAAAAICLFEQARQRRV